MCPQSPTCPHDQYAKYQYVLVHKSLHNAFLCSSFRTPVKLLKHCTNIGFCSQPSCTPGAILLRYPSLLPQGQSSSCTPQGQHPSCYPSSSPGAVLLMYPSCTPGAVLLMHPSHNTPQGSTPHVTPGAILLMYPRGSTPHVALRLAPGTLPLMYPPGQDPSCTPQVSPPGQYPSWTPRGRTPHVPLRLLLGQNDL